MFRGVSKAGNSAIVSLSKMAASSRASVGSMGRSNQPKRGLQREYGDSPTSGGEGGRRVRAESGRRAPRDRPVAWPPTFAEPWTTLSGASGRGGRIFGRGQRRGRDRVVSEARACRAGRSCGRGWATAGGVDGFFGGARARGGSTLSSASARRPSMNTTGSAVVALSRCSTLLRQ